MTPLTIRDVRARMPNYAAYQGTARPGRITGIAVHHSAAVNPATGVSMDTAATIFDYHVNVRGWSRGGYHYLVQPNGIIEHALDEHVGAPHAGFIDPADALGLEQGQYWNNHLLAVCVLGWFDNDRAQAGTDRPIPNWFTAPAAAQWSSLVGLLATLIARHRLSPDDVRGHRELAGCRTRCPGANMDLDVLRQSLRAARDAEA